MKNLENRIRELEMTNIGLQFQIACLMEKNNLTIEEMKCYARKCLEKMPKEETNSDYEVYLKGFLIGEFQLDNSI
ncbi:hypothetical protein [Enterococcus sp. HY326]|uniref:hypothetical protein n=1 Tax=Enterococcus sp. HY326 TaxID=2971265 RepID=UPI00223F2172|nr:hypothetical protein [Enterococcus sp. HY326]